MGGISKDHRTSTRPPCFIRARSHVQVLFQHNSRSASGKSNDPSLVQNLDPSKCWHAIMTIAKYLGQPGSILGQPGSMKQFPKTAETPQCTIIIRERRSTSPFFPRGIDRLPTYPPTYLRPRVNGHQNWTMGSRTRFTVVAEYLWGGVTAKKNDFRHTSVFRSCP